MPQCNLSNSSLCGKQAANLPDLVEYNNKKVAEVHMGELTSQLTASVTADPPLPVDEVVSAAMQKKQEQDLPDAEIIKVRPSDWTCCPFGSLAVF